MNMLEDAALVAQFIQQGALDSNQSLRTEPAFDCVQLLANRGELIATKKVVKGFKTVILRQRSPYCSLVHRLLVEHNYMPVGATKDAECVQYQARPIPPDYKLNCAEAQFLWKQWWIGRRNSNRHTIQTDFLIYFRNTWYPIREVTCNQGVLFVTTLVSELVFQGSDAIVWLSQHTQHQHIDPVSDVKARAQAFLAATSSDSRFKFSQQSSSRAEPLAIAQSEWIHQADLSSAGSHSRPSEAAEMHPDLRQVIRFCQGKLHITTALGEVVVEGSNLKFWLDESGVSGTAKPVDLSSYRDRNGHQDGTQPTVLNLARENHHSTSASAEAG